MADGRVAALKERAVHGVCTLAQARRAGLSAGELRWLVASERWQRPHRGVYLLGADPPTWIQRAAIALARAGPMAALSHLAAAFLLRLDGLADAPPRVIDVTVPRTGSRARARTVRLHHVQHPFRASRASRLRVTGVVRTLLDLSAGLDPCALEFALDGAQRRFPPLHRWLARELEQHHRGVPGTALLRELVALRTMGLTDSPLEARVRRAIRLEGLPPPRAQLTVLDRGTFVARVDLAWPVHLVALHVDGFRWHHQRERFERDARQRSRLSALGWRSVIVTHDAFHDTQWLRELAALLAVTSPQRRLALSA